jgi:hypothetical protein
MNVFFMIHMFYDAYQFFENIYEVRVEPHAEGVISNLCKSQLNSLNNF